ncbi:MAG: hypothetical protein KDJ51_10245 [Nitratireductor sp.]|nr:hypothetical protein [Nitratireductor sp.]
MGWLIWLPGPLAIILMAVFIHAIVVSYRIEKAAGARPGWGLPRNTNLFGSAFGGKADEPGELKDLRRRLRWLLAICLAGLLAMAALAMHASGGNPASV